MNREKIFSILLWAYLWILFVLQSISVDVKMTILFFLLLGLLSCFLTFLILRLCTEKISGLNIETENRYGIWYGALISAITISVFFVYFTAQYPGGISQDTVEQYAQAIGERTYNDWHPVLHTLLFFKIPLKLGYQFAGIVFFQLLYFSLAFGYLGYVLLQNQCPKVFLAIICIYVWINPFMATYMMYPWKDIGMTIFAIVLISYYIQILCSQGKWLDRKRNLVLFSIVSVSCTYMRHNAVLFTAPLVCIGLFYVIRNIKTRVLAVCSIMICLLLVKLLYAFIQVERPGERTLELAGLPATIWCNVMQKNEAVLPDETRMVMRELAAQEAYADIYETGEFNSIKWSGEYDTDRLNQMSCQEIMKYTLQCFRYAPVESFEAFVKLTDIVWAFDGNEKPERVSVAENHWGISERHYLPSRELFRQIRDFFSAGFAQTFFGSIGFELLILFIVAIIMLVKGRFSFLHVIPVFCYDFGTMLLLSGSDYRFFLFNIPLWMVMIYIMLKDRRMFVPES